MKKFLGLEDSEDGPFGKGKVWEPADDDEVPENDEDEEKEISDLEPLPITTWRRFFPGR